MDTTYRLYYSPGACSLAAHIALEETGAHFELACVPVAERANWQPAYLAINPKARVPELAISGCSKVPELPAIMTFIARRHNEVISLLPYDVLEESRCHEWLAWLTGWVHGLGFGGLWRPERFICDEQRYAEVRERARDTIAVSFTDIERKLGDGREYAALSGYSIVDPMLLVLYRWGLRIDMPMQTGYPAWTTLARRILSRPAVQRAE
jgi:glutathione S-transferase